MGLRQRFRIEVHRTLQRIHHDTYNNNTSLQITFLSTAGKRNFSAFRTVEDKQLMFIRDPVCSQRQQQN